MYSKRYIYFNAPITLEPLFDCRLSALLEHIGSIPRGGTSRSALLAKTLNHYCVCLLYFQGKRWKEVHSATSFEVVVYIHFSRWARLRFSIWMALLSTDSPRRLPNIGYISLKPFPNLLLCHYHTILICHFLSSNKSDRITVTRNTKKLIKTAVLQSK